MRIFLVTQGVSLRVFHRMIQHLKKTITIEMASYYVADSLFYKRYISEVGPVEINGEVITEWSIVNKGIKRKCTDEEIFRWEKMLGVESLWSVIIGDRRMMYGRDCQAKQNYKSEYSLYQLQGITLEMAETLWNLFERNRPDVILSFIPTTIGAIMAHFVARAQDILSLNLKSTKIANFITLSKDILERHQHIRDRYLEYKANSITDKQHFLEQAKKYLNSAQRQRLVYEGSLAFQKKKKNLKNNITFISKLPKGLIKYLMAILNSGKIDPQHPHYLKNFYQQEFGKKWRNYRSQKVLSPIIIPPEKLSSMSYVFFPLNSEPEIALSLYSRFTLNQIEVIRNISQSVPLGMFVVVKEHPRSRGWRSSGYYRRILEIPNVRIVPVGTPTNLIIQHAKATFVISSFVGFESALQGKPVITIGYCPYDILPDTMVRKISAYEDLPTTFQELSTTYQRDDYALLCYIAAVMHESVPIDLYSAMLRKSDRERGTGNLAQISLNQQYDALASYFKRRFEEETISYRDPKRC